MTVLAFAIITWLAVATAVAWELHRAAGRPVTEVDRACARVDRDLDAIEEACRGRHPSHWRADQ